MLRALRKTMGGPDRIGGFSFSHSDRLLKRSEFLAVSQSGQKIQDSNFIVIYRANQKNRPRLGLTVSKRVGKAVTRNRLKRLVREFFRKNRCAIEANWDINIIAKPASARLTTSEAEKSLSRLFYRLKAG